MTSLNQDAPPAPLKQATQNPFVRFVPALYATTLFISALLLFGVQPMFAKTILPRLGGAPAVWSVAMVFFQAALLVGYAYAHLLMRMLRPLGATLVHLAVLSAATLVLPIGIAHGFGAPPEDGGLLWLFALMVASIGLPFVALAASAPLLQSWFSLTDHPRAHNPYVLYAASNFGSFAALLAYPFVAEPLLTLRDQTWLWSFGYAILAVLVAAAGLVAAHRSNETQYVAAYVELVPPPRDWISWMIQAAIPAGLMVAVTAYISTDIVAAPFLWVLPLALYLLTFVALFRDPPWINAATVAWWVPLVVAPLAISMQGFGKAYWFVIIGVNLAAFVLLALACHGELYRRRPEPARLTEFYLWTAFGGVLGGIFAGLIAPNIFSGTYEYPILIVAALLAMPGTVDNRRRFVCEAGPVLAIAAAIAAAIVIYDVHFPLTDPIMFQACLIGLVALMLWQRRRPARFLALVVLAFVVTELLRPFGLARIEIARSFFGVHQIFETADGRYRLLFHGTTLHGAERVREADGKPVTGRPEPLTYYYFGGPISESIAAARSTQGGLKQVAVIGLGTGSLACHRKDGERWTFFEIDPMVVRIARDPQLFRFMSECGQNSPIVLGDARLTLAASPQHYDLIILDAFSSDTIPVHLLTREALAVYLSHLSPHGVLVFHISNRNLDLPPVVVADAEAEGLISIVKGDDRANDLETDYRANALVALLARDVADLGDLPDRPGWVKVKAGGVSAWTDDYSNVISALARQKLFIP
jgi:hypothetical protein